MMLKGYLGSRATFDGAYVTVTKPFRGSVTIPLHTIGAVELLKAGPMMRALRFAQPGMGNVASWNRYLNSMSLSADPYALTLFFTQQRQAEAFRNVVLQARARMAMPEGSAAASQAWAGQWSAPTRLAQ
jgi:hypothetical protein